MNGTSGSMPESEVELGGIILSWLGIKAYYRDEETILRQKCARAYREELSEKMRIYLYRHVVLREKMKDIAASEGVNVSTVSRTVFRAERRLRRTMQYAV